MNAHPYLRLASLAGAIAVLQSPASAQLAGRVIVTPYIGAYVPTDHVARIGFTLGGTSINADAKQASAAAFGANVSYWITDHVAIEGGSAYTASGVRSVAFVDQPGVISSTAHTENAHVWLGSAKVMMQLLPEESLFNARFGIGPAIISRGGTAYDGGAEGKLTGLTNYGAAISLCTRIGILPNVAVRLRGENYMYYSKIGWKSATNQTQDFSFDSRLQNDFVLSAGVQVVLNR